LPRIFHIRSLGRSQRQVFVMSRFPKSEHPRTRRHPTVSFRPPRCQRSKQLAPSPRGREPQTKLKSGVKVCLARNSMASALIGCSRRDFRTLQSANTANTPADGGRIHPTQPTQAPAYQRRSQICGIATVCRHLRYASVFYFTYSPSPTE